MIGYDLCVAVLKELGLPDKTDKRIINMLINRVEKRMEKEGLKNNYSYIHAGGCEYINGRIKFTEGEDLNKIGTISYFTVLYGEKIVEITKEEAKGIFKEVAQL